MDTGGNATGPNEHTMNELEFGDAVRPHRRELQLHCYRILGSVQDAEDLLQETLLAAWRGLDTFDGRASVRTWLYRIATNRCLNALRDARRRPAGRTLPPPPFDPPDPARWDESTVPDPYPDTWLGDVADHAPGPEARYEAREAVELCFVEALQSLPARQRAMLILKDVVGLRTDEVATILDTTATSVKAGLQRARGTLAGRNTQSAPGGPLAKSSGERELARRFADAFEADDVDGLVRLLTEDALFRMPPYPHAYVGQDNIAAFLQASRAWRAGRRYVLLPAYANTRPAFACYLRDADSMTALPAGLIVLGFASNQIAVVTRFVDPALFRAFGFPAATSS